MRGICVVDVDVVVPRIDAGSAVVVPVIAIVVVVAPGAPGHPPAGAGMMSPTWLPWPFNPFRSTVIWT